MSLRLVGVQILDLVEEGDVSAASLGFGQEEGYVQEEAEVSAATPFDDPDDTKAIPEDGDF